MCPHANCSHEDQREHVINQSQENLGFIEFLNSKVQVETVGFCADAPVSPSVLRKAA
jgi:hypothetical protein